MNSLILADVRNRLFKRDGEEFKREAYKAANLWLDDGECEVHELKSKRFWAKNIQSTKAISNYRGAIDRFALFSHGTWGWNSAGFYKWNCKDLAQALVAKANNKLEIVLYSCQNGRSRWTRKDLNKPVNQVTYKDGFAAQLCAELHRRGMDPIIWAHTTRGHLSRNPYLVRIWVDRHGYLRRNTVVKTKPATKWRAWRGLLKTNFRFEFPGMLLHEIRERLALWQS
jgi:hypothetical protein